MKWVCWVAIGMVAIVIIASFVIMILITEGSMPSESSAISIKEEALLWMQKCEADTKECSRLPNSIVKINPLYHKASSSGALLVFKKRFVNDYGYYYSSPGAVVPEGIRAFCREASPGIYRYYNPG